MRNGVIETASSDFVFADGLNEARLEGAMDLVGLEVDAAFALYPFDRQKPVPGKLPVRKTRFKGRCRGL